MMVNNVNPKSSHNGESDSPDWRYQRHPRFGDTSLVANRIRQLRLDRGLTLEELAERVGTSLQQISRLELSDRRLSEKWIRPIARALGVSPDDLFADTPPDPAHVAQQREQFLVWQLWSVMSLDEKKFWANWGRSKGIDLLSAMGGGSSNKPKRGRSAA
jgi:transcriptional regulator with XRE-family HTH domain